jgi:homogentisate 1,2-dioxygenase
MPHYYSLGKIPHKRHTQFRKDDGSLYAEELVSSEGFASVYSLVYHAYPPTLVREVETPYSVAPKVAVEHNLKQRSFKGFSIAPEPDYVKSRKTIFLNQDVHLGLAAPSQGTNDYFFKNSDADEMLFVHKGAGELRTMFGKIRFGYGDYLVIPRGVIYQIHFDSGENRLLVMESYSPIETPNRYRNAFGQLLEHSPFCERDIRKPVDLETHDEKGDFRILIKKQGLIFPYIYATHPFDVVGWDGYLFPYAFNAFDFEPITGRVHQPPPVHQTFATRGLVVCTFAPRLYDYHPDAIPAPYNHSNIDSDELLYYVEGEFMSRKNMGEGHMTLHPMGIPHGPAPGTVERSIGAKGTEELAVMVDTFRPLFLTDIALQIEDPGYYQSWLEALENPGS